MVELQQEALARHSAQVLVPARPTVSKSLDWAKDYARRLAVTDSLSVLLAVITAQLVRFGTDSARVETVPATEFPSLLGYGYDFEYWALSAVLVVAWLVALAVFHSRDTRAVGSGPEEYRQVAHASFGLFGTVAILAFLLQVEIARGYLAVALPLGMFLLFLSRRLWRQWLVAQRRQGRLISNVLVVGAHRSAASMANTFEQGQSAGYRVVGVCVPGWGKERGDLIQIQSHLVPVLGDETSVLEAIRVTGADTVAVSNTEYLGADGMRALAWELEAADVDMVVSAGVVDVAGPRLHVRPVAGLPWLHVDKPQYRGARKVGKVLVDLLGAVVGLVVLSPLMLLVAIAIKLDSRGPVFYRAERVGLNGRPFAMMKFRSMVVNADRRGQSLAHLNQGSGPLFKLHNDPRVTRVGRILRRMSIDELPQLFNVLLGQMSIVGPRPPLEREVVTYTGQVHRRLLVKPGITGLWQVSGRSNLSWDESVRLDLYYVENWSLTQDLIIVWRTFGAVFRSTGAY